MIASHALHLLTLTIAGARAWVVQQPHRLPAIPFRRSSSSLAASCHIHSIITAGLIPQEVDVLKQAIEAIILDAPAFSMNISSESIRTISERATPESVPGATGRVVVVGVTEEAEADDDGEELWIEFQMALSQQWDEYLYIGSIDFVKQPFLLSVESSSESLFTDREDDDSSVLTDIRTFVEKQVIGYELRTPLPQHEVVNITTTPSLAIPTLQYEVDGATVTDTSLSDPTTFFDTSSVLVFDDLISDDLRQRLLNVVLGNEDKESHEIWDDLKDGPDPRRWVRGVLVDTPVDETKEQQPAGGFGLTVEAIDDLCYEDHDALQELECILSSLVPSVMLSRMDGNVFGESVVSPLVANAPIHGDCYQPHIDADPYLLPPSPWTDVFGRYPNRAPGKPRFMSCLVYLNKKWDDAWGAPTRIWDVASNTTVDIQPKPRRVVLMDQDITHSVVAPKLAAGKRPRYSLVWKLVLHPSHNDSQDMKESIRQVTWPQPTRIGSAATRA